MPFCFGLFSFANPPELARLVVYCLPRLSEELMVVGLASLSLQAGLSPASTRANDDAYQSIIFSPVTWAAIAFTKSS